MAECELKNRGVRDIFVVCADGLSGIKEAIEAAYPETEYQRCIVHVVRNTLKYVADKDKKAFANDLKTIYHAPDEEHGYRRMEAVRDIWDKKYPGCMKRWEDNWDCISPMFKFSQAVRKVIYTTNAIESLNSGYRRLNRNSSVFPSPGALLKAMYLATHELTKKVDDAGEKLGIGLCRIVDHVPRQTDRRLISHTGNSPPTLTDRRQTCYDTFDDGEGNSVFRPSDPVGAPV